MATGVSLRGPLLATLDALVPEDGRKEEEEQHDGNGRRDGPVPIDEEYIPEHAADHERIRATEERGNRELADRGDEDEQAPADDPRHRQRQGDVDEGLPAFRAEIGGRIEEVEVLALEVRIERQDHERQVRIEDAEIDGEIVVEHG